MEVKNAAEGLADTLTMSVCLAFENHVTSFISGAAFHRSVFGHKATIKLKNIKSV